MHFKEAIGNRIEKICDSLGVESHMHIRNWVIFRRVYELPADRTKPWGTGQAVLACKDVLHEPFACVINADDYYGKEAFVKLHEFLVKDTAPEKADELLHGRFHPWRIP